MLVIGLTGNFGTGKSTVGKILSEMGAVHIDADALSRSLLDQNTQSYNELVAAFGKGILDSDNNINRRKLGDIALKSSENSCKINAIMHHRIEKIIQEHLEHYRNQNQKVVIIEAALLFPSNIPDLCNYIWVTVAPVSVITNRLVNNRSYSRKEIEERLRQQMSQDELMKKADAVIDTNCSMEELIRKITDLWNKVVL
jgi:dephospho-CoA kinase